MREGGSESRDRSTGTNADPGFHFRLRGSAEVQSGLRRRRKKRKRNAGRRICFMSRTQAARGSRHGKGGLRRPPAVGRARLPAFHHGSRQRDLRHPRRSSGQASWDAAVWALPTIACPSPGSTSRPARNAGRLMPEPPGSGLQDRPRAPHSPPMARCASGPRPSRARLIRGCNVTETGTDVKGEHRISDSRRHCKERRDEAIQNRLGTTGLLSCARNNR